MSEYMDTAVSMYDVVAVVEARRREIVMTFLVAMLLVALITVLWPRQYKAEMKILVKNDRAGLIVSANDNQSRELRSDVDETEVNSEIELLTSRDLLQKVALRCGLDRLFNAPDRAVALEKAANQLSNALSISAVKKSNVIVVEYLDKDRKRAAAVLAALGDLYFEQHLKVHGTPGSYTAFKNAADEWRDRLAEGETRMSDFERREKVDLLEQQKEAALRASTDAESALVQVEADIEAHKHSIADDLRQLASVPARITTQKKTSTNEYSIDHLTVMLADAQNRRTQLLTKYLPNDRLVQEIDQEIADTRAALERAKETNGLEAQTDVNPLHQTLQLDVAKQQAELAGLESRKKILLGQAGRYRDQLARLAAVSFAFNDLVRSRKEAEDNYLLYKKKAEEARVAEMLDRQKVANVSIAEHPVEPRTPFWPKKSLNFAVGGVLAILLSVGRAFVAEILNGPVRGASDLEAIAGVPVLAVSYGRTLRAIEPARFATHETPLL